MKPKIVVICGPTGIGKTAVAIRLAERFNGEIVGADSMQIYRHMDVGTAKPTPEEQRRIKHHMIDIVDPDTPFDAARYAHMGRECVDQIHKGAKSVFVAGGTGLYIKALVSGLFKPRSADSQIRKRLRSEADMQGIAPLYQRLAKTDPQAAKRIHPNDRFRIIRALAVYESTGKTLSAFHNEHGFLETPFQALKIGLHTARRTLYDRIDKRVLNMVENGLLGEVEMLLARGYGQDLKPMQAIGYRHMLRFVRNRVSWDEAVATMQRATRRYAKRQLTWFRADPEIEWHTPDEQAGAGDRVAAFLERGIGRERN